MTTKQNEIKDQIITLILAIIAIAIVVPLFTLLETNFCRIVR